MSRTETTNAGLYGSDASPAAQRRALTGGEVPVAVYGLGKMGLPLATVLADVTGNVVGVDIDDEVVAAIEHGETPVENEPGLADAVETAVIEGSMRATSDVDAAAAAASIHVVLVPTLLDEADEPDLSALVALTRDIAMGMDAGDVLLVESTVPPGTCADTLWPILRRAEPSSSTVGLAFCPERTMSGTALADIRGSYPKIVGGVDDESTRVARLVYEEVTSNDVLAAPDARTAECVKVFEGLYRDVNIALANELATTAEELGVDVNTAIDLANTQPFCDIHTPGIGVGGHCIPVYPHFLLERLETPMPLVRMARQTNEQMPRAAIERLCSALDADGSRLDGHTIAVLGVTYRPGVDEIRHSPAFPVVRELSQRGATVHAVDPVCSQLSAFDAIPTDIEELPDLDLDAAVLVTAHEAFDAIDWDALPEMVVLDGRQALSPSGGHRVETIGDGSGGT